ncbi:MAG: 2-oxo acid dehydrogenase subunit E2 [Mogibacterium sp.]|nr:2-oxo acid dehydrogenase subunit E2 [Mogibacterium sp.]
MRNKRRDGKRVRWPDGYHNILPYIMPKRTEAEVSMTEQFDVTDLVKYMAERNEKEGTNLKIFHAICTAVARTIYHRPKLNYFISGRTYYERPDITLSFVVKQKFEDEAEETLMFLKVDPDMNFDSISRLIVGDVKKVRKEKSNDLDKLMDFFGSLPRPFLEAFFGTLRRLEYHGIMPKALTAGDPNYSSVLLSNLGSIRSDSCYHHLSNYGTCSVMITIGVLHKEQKLMEDGSWQPRDVINCTFTIDERLADGFYYAKSLRIAKYMLEHPEVMNEPISKPVPVEL